MEDKLIKILKYKMEEYGMPEFKDSYPAIDILQTVKDFGYDRHVGLEVDKRKLKKLINKTVETPMPLKILSEDFDDIEKITQAISKNINQIVRVKE